MFIPVKVVRCNIENHRYHRMKRFGVIQLKTAHFQHRDPAELMTEWLARYRTVVAVMAIGGALWARISAQAYNTAEDYDQLLSVM